MPLIRRDSQGAPQTATGSATALRDGATEARWAAARSLTAPADVGALRDALESEQDPKVREAILTSLARIGGVESAEAVIPYIRSNDAGLRTAALDSLRAMPEAVAVSLPSLLADVDPDVRLLVCELTRVLPGPDAPRLLCDLIRADPERNVCAAAVEVLAEVGGPEALPALEACAARFGSDPFLTFAIRVAAERIRAQPADHIG